MIPNRAGSSRIYDAVGAIENSATKADCHRPQRRAARRPDLPGPNELSNMLAANRAFHLRVKQLATNATGCVLYDGVSETTTWVRQSW